MGKVLKSIPYKKSETVIGKKCGTITVSVYKNDINNNYFFYVKSSNENILPVSYVIEDTLYLY